MITLPPLLIFLKRAVPWHTILSGGLPRRRPQRASWASEHMEDLMSFTLEPLNVRRWDTLVHG